MRPIRLNYAVFQPMDIFLSHSNKPCGRVIRLATTMRFDPKDDTTPTHGGFITDSYGQFFATEMSPSLAENSLERYTGKREQIVEVWRWKGFNEPVTRLSACKYLAEMRRRNMENTRYDLPGAILSSPLGRMVFGWIPGFKNRKERYFCTETVCDILRRFGETAIPAALNPYYLSIYFRKREKDGAYSRIKDWKL